jgi:hypothetical protein
MIIKEENNLKFCSWFLCIQALYLSPTVSSKPSSKLIHQEVVRYVRKKQACFDKVLYQVRVPGTCTCTRSGRLKKCVTHMKCGNVLAIAHVRVLSVRIFVRSHDTKNIGDL